MLRKAPKCEKHFTVWIPTKCSRTDKFALLRIEKVKLLKLNFINISFYYYTSTQYKSQINTISFFSL